MSHGTLGRRCRSLPARHDILNLPRQYARSPSFSPGVDSLGYGATIETIVSRSMEILMACIRLAAFGVALGLAIGLAGQANAAEPSHHPDPYARGWLDATTKQHEVLQGLVDREPEQETRDYLYYAMRSMYADDAISFEEWEKLMAEGRKTIAEIAERRAAHPEIFKNIPVEFPSQQ